MQDHPVVGGAELALRGVHVRGNSALPALPQNQLRMINLALIVAE